MEDNAIKLITIETVKDSFAKYFSKAKKETKHILLDRLFTNERRIASCIAGLQGSLGSFWEILAKKFLLANNYEIIENDQLLRPAVLPVELNNLIAQTKSHRENTGGGLESFKQGLNRIFRNENSPSRSNALPMLKGKGTDIIFKINSKVYICDVKTVQTNANGGNSYNESVILWTAYYKYFNQTVDANNVKACLVFPYNSSDEHDDSGLWREFGSRLKPLTRQDILIGNEFWSLVSNNANALSSIIGGFETISKDKGFINFYKKVFKCKDQSQLTEFANQVRLREILARYNISPKNSGQTQTLWQHIGKDCEFKSTIKKLFDGKVAICPICKRPIRR